ncbi:helix-turn-helix domain-containing protein [Jinshanibacter sp. LJY008]|uniref:Helix-turn-helix domain-containing protein n=1 Tax=Limnobaculum eriocheiris TaxID=2897391 RepID=A0A9X1SJE7_9GAMM|nr:helix-turn-helix domain-containing protein [Limnobaculum eriocheiris]MCD1125448.1 helix-turn-helix domain-containing protein [Limnobaculum eriocheiris]
MTDNLPDCDAHRQWLMDTFIRSGKTQQLTIKKGKVYPMTDDIYCIQEGFFGIYMNEERLLTFYEGPALLGLTNLYAPPTYFYIKPGQNITVNALTIEDARKVIAEKGLYESVNYVLANNMTEYYRVFAKTINPNNYAFIRLLLIELAQSSDEIKNSVTVASYIIKRSWLSRSYVMMVLSELRKGDYITMNNGKLMSITTLPERF